MKRLSLRAQIVGVFVLLYGSLFVLLLMWMMQHVQEDFLKEVDKELYQTGHHLEKVLHRGDAAVDSVRNSLADITRVFPLPRFICIRRNDTLLYRCRDFPSKESLKVTRDSVRFVTVVRNEDWYRVVQMRRSDLRIQIAERITATEHTIQESLYLILFSIPIVILISIVSGYFLVKHLLRPLDAITARAKHITSENLNQRIAVPRTNDEIARVVKTLNAMIERLENSFSQLEQFSANASHELRTPLTILKGEMEVALQRDRDPEEYRTVLASNLEEVHRVSKTVENLFMLARIDGQGLSLQKEMVDLEPLLEEIAREMTYLADERGVTIEVSLNPVPAVRGDAVMLVQVFINLIENAIKYNCDGGTVRIQLQEKPRNLRIDITDTGVGIPIGEHEKVFDRFYRVDKALSRRQGGAGLGLSLARLIVHLHAGRLTVQSTEGKGSTFSVFLPK